MAVGYRLYHQCLPKNTQLASRSVTTEDGVLLRENAVHTHPPSQVQAQVDRVVSYLSGLSYLVCASVTDS